MVGQPVGYCGVGPTLQREDHSMAAPYYNPFSPDQPARPDLVAGRAEETSQIKAALTALARGRPRHLLILSPPWLGKTSLALLAAQLARHHRTTTQRHNTVFVPVFCPLGAATTLDAFCTTVLNQSASSAEKGLTRIGRRLVRSIKGVRLGPLGITLDRTSQSAAQIVAAFPAALADLFSSQSAGLGPTRAFILILDQTENLSSIAGSASLIKALVEHLRAERTLNVALIMTATDEALERFCQQDPSFASLFCVASMRGLSTDGILELLDRTASSGHPPKAFTDDAKELIARLCAGFPGFAQQIGYTAFAICRAPLIDKAAVLNALTGTKLVKGALASLADKHFRSLLDLKPIYAKILEAIDNARSPLKPHAISEALGEAKNLGPYLRTLTARNIIRRTGPSASPGYEIAAPVVSLWLHLQRLLPQATLSTVRSAGRTRKGKRSKQRSGHGNGA